MKLKNTTKRSPAYLTFLPVFTGALLLSSFATEAAVTLAAWDDWAIQSGSNITADDLAPGFAATTVSSRFNAGFGSADGTYGANLSGANTSVTGGLLPNSLAPANRLTSFSITNNTGTDYSINTLHFDWVQRNNSIKTFVLTYDSGGLGPASTVLLSETYLINPASGDDNEILHNYDITLSDFLTDTVLSDGETASFTLTPTSFYSSNSSVFDNLAIQGTAVPEPSGVALLGIAGTLGLLRRRRRA